MAIVSHTRFPAQGSWEFSINNGVIWNLVPESLSDQNALVLSADALLRFQPAPEYSGQPAGLTTRLWDGRWVDDGANVDITSAIGALGGFADENNILNVTVDVVSVNDEPSFTAQNPPQSSAGAGPQTVSLWATFNPGAENETAQTAVYEVTNVAAPNLFQVPPSVDPLGNLTYTPSATATGSTTFQVRVRDSGGTANGGINQSPTQTFAIQIVGDEIFENGFES
ncbi:MAG: Ig-like domain-containing protein [Lysobacterales bacterium]